MIERMDLTYFYSGKESCEPGYTWGPGVKDSYKLVFVHEGRGTYSLNGKLHHLHEGQGFVVYPDMLLYMKADENEPWTHSWLAFHGECVESLLAQAHLTIDSPVFELSNSKWFDIWHDQLDAAHAMERNGSLMIHSLLYLIVANWLEELLVPIGQQPVLKAKEKYVRKATEYMKANYSKKLSITDLASRIGIDRIYLSALFKELDLQSPQAYLLQLRMDKASELMVNPELTVSEIAHSVGYQDPLLFSKMFKKVKGASPSHYRQTMNPEQKQLFRLP
ncbi:AraC family transcriptional regulator [Paenibacillus sp. YIM B09110]|uniref:AraC family transcriptional regulator n=1 Tax=Paenibacillus sp. YIM B09110 TaxID=3126102 RepID=UPI00301CCF91